MIVFRKKTDIDGQSIELGRTKTDDRGYWKIRLRSGIKRDRTYRAQANTKKLRGGAGHKHTCKRRASPELPV